MNHLAHFLLAPADDASRAGTLLGDFVRGTDLSAWPEEVARAIRLHRRIDAITDSHAAVGALKGRLPPPWRRYAGIVLDVYFDHLLIARWEDWHHEPLSDFAASAHAGLARIAPSLDGAAGMAATRLAEHRGLLACATPTGMARVLGRIGARLSRPLDLALALPHMASLDADARDAFTTLFRDLRAEAMRHLETSTRSSRPSAASVSR